MDAMTNLQLTEHLLGVIRSLPDDDRQWLLSQLEHNMDERLLARDLDRLAMAGGTFADLAIEPDLYSFNDGEPIRPR
ncbi:MAG: hypothetical protein FJ082_10780 [Cyanobacteria bacterium K_Offshore_surface_m2_011]|nr:hypothetical protein [Cyanobacteria bacterium K_Offshore_surface_m2_011]